MYANYRCAACGSPRVVQQTEKEGYSYGKGIVGTMVFGAAGAVAGIDGKNKTVYKCPDCGLTLDHAMDMYTTQIINMGPSIGDQLAQSQLGVSWEWLKKKYRNIEDDSVGAPSVSSAVSASTEQISFKRPLEDFPAELREINKTLSGEQIRHNMELFREAKILNQELQKRVDEEIERRMQEALDAKIEEMKQAAKDKIEECQEKKKEAEESLMRYKKELSSIGFFEFRQKSLKKWLIRNAQEKIEKADAHLKDSITEYENVIRKIENEKEALQESLKETARNKIVQEYTNQGFPTRSEHDGLYQPDGKLTRIAFLAPRVLEILKSSKEPMRAFRIFEEYCNRYHIEGWRPADKYYRDQTEEERAYEKDMSMAMRQIRITLTYLWNTGKIIRDENGEKKDIFEHLTNVDDGRVRWSYPHGKE